MTTRLYLVPTMKISEAMTHFFHNLHGVHSPQRWLQTSGHSAPTEEARN